MATGHRDLIAYLRVSSEAQDTQLQRDALGEAGCVKFFEDKISSRKADRPGLAAALEYLRAATPSWCGSSTASAGRSRTS